jgi:predicted RNase H-like HicB family nuclease
MDNQDFDRLLENYKQATDKWVEAIRAEELLATEDHSMVAMEHWDAAGLEIVEAERAAKKAHDLYKNALRKKNYGF